MNYDERPATYGDIDAALSTMLVRRFRHLHASVHRAYLKADHELFKSSRNSRRYSRKQALEAHAPAAEFYAISLRARLFLAALAGGVISADLVSDELAQLSQPDNDDINRYIERFKETLFLDRHCDLPTGTVTEQELLKPPPKLYSITVQSVVPKSVFYFRYTDAMIRSRNPEYRQEQYVVDLDGELKILDMTDDDCICGGAAFCYIQ